MSVLFISIPTKANKQKSRQGAAGFWCVCVAYSGCISKSDSSGVTVSPFLT